MKIRIIQIRRTHVPIYRKLKCLYLKNDQIFNRKPTFWQENTYCKENVQKYFHNVSNKTGNTYNLLFKGDSKESDEKIIKPKLCKKKEN